jgi:hypothetical protein
MYYENEAKNAGLAIDCFEAVLEESQEKKELLEASNGKSSGWWWKLVLEDPRNYFKRDEESPFQMWTKGVAATYPDDATAKSYYALSHWFIKGTRKEELVWFHLASSFLRSENQPSPSGFYYLFAQSLYSYQTKDKTGDDEIWLLPVFLIVLKGIEALLKTITLKDIYMIQRFVRIIFVRTSTAYPIHSRVSRQNWKSVEKVHPSKLNEEQWSAWKRFTISVLGTTQTTLGQLATQTYGNRYPIDFNTLVGSEADLKVQLEARIIRPKNFPFTRQPNEP